MAPHAETNQANGHANGINGESHAKPDLFTVNSPNVKYTDESILSKYTYRTTSVSKDASTGNLTASPKEKSYNFKLDRKVPKVGVMLVGWGGNNGSTVTAGIIANKKGLSWDTKEGKQNANYYGSLVMSSTVKLGMDAETGEEVYVPLHKMLPMAHPDDFVIGGWDISGMNIADSMDRAKVLEPALKELVRDEMQAMKPLPSVYYPDFIAANQGERADNVLEGSKACNEHVEKLRKDIRDFKANNSLDKVITLWTANTERYASITPGVNDTAANLLSSIKTGHEEIAPSTIFAVASILENSPFINGSPQNTFVPGVIELASQHNAFIGGDDFKSGQTKMKSALVDFLINAGIKLTSIASYNHLGNNDGMNLSSHKQFRSKEISKSTVVDDMVAANHLLYGKTQTSEKTGVKTKPDKALQSSAANIPANPAKPGNSEQEREHPDHCVVIKYMPAVGDNKRALDEYHGEIFLGGHQTISIFNVCEDSLLASPLIIDLCIVAEIMTRVSWKDGAVANGAGATDEEKGWKGFHSVLSVLSFMLKAPVTPSGTPVINSLSKQRNCMINIFRAFLGLEVDGDLGLEWKLF